MTYQPEQPARHLWRKLGATLACLLWLAGFEIVPGVHQAFHETWGAHHHAGELVGASSDRDHRHAGPKAEPGRRHHVPAGLDSHHASDASHGHDHATGHDHDHAVKTAEAVPDLFGSEPSKATFASRSDQHGAHALAHRSVVALATPDAWPHAAITLVVSAEFGSDLDGRFVDRAPTTNRARGPPASDSTSV